MKNILIIIGIIVVIGAIFMLLNKPKPAVELPTINEEEVSTLASGNYIVENQAINWQGRRPLIQGYMDSGKVDIASGEFNITQEVITSGLFEFDLQTIEATTTANEQAPVSSLTGHLKSADFFDVENFPTATLTINDAELIAGLNYQVTGDLEIKGITNPITFSAQIFEENNQARILAEIVLDRTLWDITYGSGNFFADIGNNMIDDNFSIFVDIVADRIEE